MIRIDGGKAAFGNPLGDDRRLGVDQFLQRPLEECPDGGGAMQDFIGEQARGAGPLPRQANLDADVARQFGDRIASGIKGPQGLQPVG